MNFLKKLILYWTAIAGIFWILSNKIFITEFNIIGGYFAYIFIAMLFGLSNSIIKPILNILTLPIKFLTLGFSSIAINTLLLWGVTKIINFLAISDIALNITDITTYVLSSLIITLSLIILGWFLD